MLQEPEERVAEDTVELMINVSRANHETKIKVLTQQGRPEVRALLLLRNSPVAFPHGTGNPSKIHILAQGAERRYHTASTPADLKTSVLNEVIFERTPIAGEDKAPMP
jgi:hypothetical protein